MLPRPLVEGPRVTPGTVRRQSDGVPGMAKEAPCRTNNGTPVIACESHSHKAVELKINTMRAQSAGAGRYARPARWRAASYSTTVAAAAAFRELAVPDIGMRTRS